MMGVHDGRTLMGQKKRVSEHFRMGKRWPVEEKHGEKWEKLGLRTQVEAVGQNRTVAH